MAVQKMQTGLNLLIRNGSIRRVERNGRAFYAAIDVVRALADTQDAAQFWNDLKTREPVLDQYVEVIDFTSAQDGERGEDAVELAGVFRVVQSIPSNKAERLKQWLVRNAQQRLDESANPELAAIRTRKLYERKGHARRWVDKRLQGASARQELTGEWFKRGVADGEQFRTLTNDLMRAAFGMDVETYRRFKHLTHTRDNLRDHMTDLELALTSLAETVAVSLHRSRGSSGLDALTRDVNDAGAIAGATLRDIEARSDHQVVTPADTHPWDSSWERTRPRRAVA